MIELSPVFQSDNSAWQDCLDSVCLSQESIDLGSPNAHSSPKDIESGVHSNLNTHCSREKKIEDQSVQGMEVTTNASGSESLVDSSQVLEGSLDNESDNVISSSDIVMISSDSTHPESILNGKTTSGKKALKRVSVCEQAELDRLLSLSAVVTDICGNSSSTEFSQSVLYREGIPDKLNPSIDQTGKQNELNAKEGSEDLFRNSSSPESSSLKNGKIYRKEKAVTEKCTSKDQSQDVHSKSSDVLSVSDMDVTSTEVNKCKDRDCSLDDGSNVNGDSSPTTVPNVQTMSVSKGSNDHAVRLLSNLESSSGEKKRELTNKQAYHQTILMIRQSQESILQKKMVCLSVKKSQPSLNLQQTNISRSSQGSDDSSCYQTSIDFEKNVMLRYYKETSTDGSASPGTTISKHCDFVMENKGQRDENRYSSKQDRDRSCIDQDGNQSHAKQDGDDLLSKQDSERSHAEDHGDGTCSKQHKDRSDAKQDDDRSNAERERDKLHSKRSGDHSYAKQNEDRSHNKQDGDISHAEQDGERSYVRKEGDRAYCKQDGYKSRSEQDVDRPRSKQDGDRSHAKQDADTPRSKQDRDRSHAKQDADTPRSKQDGDRSSSKQNQDRSHGKQGVDTPRSKQDGDRSHAKQDADTPRSKQDGDRSSSKQHGDRSSSKQDGDRSHGKQDVDRSHCKQDVDRWSSKQDVNRSQGKQDGDRWSSKQDVDRSQGKQHGDSSGSKQNGDRSHGKQDVDRSRSKQGEDRSSSKEDEDRSHGKRDGDRSTSKQDGDRSQGKQDGDSSGSKQNGDKSHGKQDVDRSRSKQGEYRSSSKQDVDRSHGKQDGDRSTSKQDGDRSHGKQDGNRLHGKQDEDRSSSKQDGDRSYGKQDGNRLHGKQDEDRSTSKQDGDRSTSKQDGDRSHGKQDGDRSGSKRDGDRSHGKQDENRLHGKQDEDRLSSKQDGDRSTSKQDGDRSHGKQDGDTSTSKQHGDRSSSKQDSGRSNAKQDESSTCQVQDKMNEKIKDKKIQDTTNYKQSNAGRDREKSATEKDQNSTGSINQICADRFKQCQTGRDKQTDTSSNKHCDTDVTDHIDLSALDGQEVIARRVVTEKIKKKENYVDNVEISDKGYMKERNEYEGRKIDPNASKSEEKAFNQAKTEGAGSCKRKRVDIFNSDTESNQETEKSQKKRAKKDSIPLVCDKPEYDLVASSAEIDYLLNKLPPKESVKENVNKYLPVRRLAMRDSILTSMIPECTVLDTKYSLKAKNRPRKDSKKDRNDCFNLRLKGYKRPVVVCEMPNESSEGEDSGDDFFGFIHVLNEGQRKESDLCKRNTKDNVTKDKTTVTQQHEKQQQQHQLLNKLCKPAENTVIESETGHPRKKPMDDGNAAGKLKLAVDEVTGALRFSRGTRNESTNKKTKIIKGSAPHMENDKGNMQHETKIEINVNNEVYTMKPVSTWKNTPEHSGKKVSKETIQALSEKFRNGKDSKTNCNDVTDTGQMLARNSMKQVPNEVVAKEIFIEDWLRTSNSTQVSQESNSKKD